MISGPRTSWKTSSKRRSRPTGSSSFNAGEIKQNAAKKQLNPYKSSLRESHNGHKGPLGNSATRDVTDDHDQDNTGGSDIDLGESDEEFGIDDILKDIDCHEEKVEPKQQINSNFDSSGRSGINNSKVPPISHYVPKRAVKESEKKSPARKVGSVDFGDRSQSVNREKMNGSMFPTHKSAKNVEADDVNTTLESEEDNDTLLNDNFSEGDATKEHKILVQTGQTPGWFSSGGFDGDNKSRRRSSSGEMQDGKRKNNQFVDDLLDDFDNDFNNLSLQKSDGTISSSTPDSTDQQFRALMNDYVSNIDKKSATLVREEDPPHRPDAPTASEANDSVSLHGSVSSLHGPGSPPTTAVRKSSLQEEETLSTVTDPTESPFIYTYNKDDDEVSQITSSLAGHSMSSLQNVSNNFGSNSSQNRNISWMSRTATGNGTGFRKPMGLYGRERGRRAAKLSKVSSHGSVGTNSFNGIMGGENSVLDEIAYALNADTTGRNQRVRRPQGRGPQSAMLDEDRNDDLSTIESQSSGFISKPYSIDVKSNVSQLGMGGVSCSDTVAGTSVTSESSTSTFAALYLGLSNFLFKAQHHAGRFFFPTSAAVTRRKKFDRSDSLEDILLEEGSKTPLTVKRAGRNSFDEDEIDYFGRAMGKSTSAKRPKTKRSCWKSTTVRVGIAFLFMTITITIFKITNRKSKVQRFYNPGSSDQVFDHATNALVDTSDIPKPRDKVKPILADATLKDIPSLPAPFQSLANVDSGPFQRGIEVPFYWHVPRSGGGLTNDVLGSCLHLTLAADAGEVEGESGVEMLKVLHFAHDVNYVNVDTSTLKGIQRAQDLNLVPSGLADAVISPLLHDATALFTPTRKGRLFTIFRDPIDRAASLFYFIQDTQWKQPNSGNAQFASMTIEQFYEGKFAESNWMTRFLTNELTKGELTEEDLNIAKEILRQKCLIGLLEEKGETFERFQKYFGWRPKNGAEEECLAKKLEWAWPMKHRHPPVEKDSLAYELIRAQNTFDLQLYEYATELFKQQEQLFP